MNIYVVVEGNSTEPKIYRNWIPLVNDKLTPVSYLPEVQANNFIIVSGNGYPFMLKIIANAIEDIRANPVFTRLVVAVDSEDLSHQQRFKQIEDHILANNPPCQYKIIVQHFCLEAWALGNRHFVPRIPKDETLKKYKQHYDVWVNDPELLPPYPLQELNRAQLAERYLRTAIRDKGAHLTYTKSKPDVVVHASYFAQLKSRLQDTGHIPSFQSFIDAFT